MADMLKGKATVASLQSRNAFCIPNNITISFVSFETTSKRLMCIFTQNIYHFNLTFMITSRIVGFIAIDNPGKQSV